MSWLINTSVSNLYKHQHLLFTHLAFRQGTCSISEIIHMCECWCGQISTQSLRTCTFAVPFSFYWVHKSAFKEVSLCSQWFELIAVRLPRQWACCCAANQRWQIAGSCKVLKATAPSLLSPMSQTHSCSYVFGLVWRSGTKKKFKKIIKKKI